MTTHLPPKVLCSLPVGARVRMARLALWKMRHGAAVWSFVLLTGIVLASASIGYLIGTQSQSVNSLADTSSDNGQRFDTYQSNGIASQLHENQGIIDRSTFPGPAHWGELQAQVVKLSVLFRRLARLAELNDPEFHLDLALGPDASLKQLSLIESQALDGEQRLRRHVAEE
jgi:hypothetical protein